MVVEEEDGDANGSSQIEHLALASILLCDMVGWLVGCVGVLAIFSGLFDFRAVLDTNDEYFLVRPMNPTPSQNTTRDLLAGSV